LKLTISLILILFLFSSCTEGEKRIVVEGEGATSEPVPPSHSSFSNPPSPVLPTVAFNSPYLPGEYPFTRSTSDFNLAVVINNPTNEIYTHKWYLNSAEQVSLRTTNSESPLPFPVVPSNSFLFPEGTQNVTSQLVGKNGNVIASEVWVFAIGQVRPFYSSSNPLAAPEHPFPDTPFVPTDTPTSISVTISNPEANKYFNRWTRNGVIDSALTTDETESPSSFLIDPSDTVNWPPGVYTITAELTGNPDTSIIYHSATWTLEVKEFEAPSFSTFSGQQPTPAVFPDIDYASANDIDLDPDILDNLGDKAFTLEWRLDGAFQEVQENSNGSNDEPLPFIITPSDVTTYTVGSHTVALSLFDAVPAASGTVLETVSWTFNISSPIVAVIEDVLPATATAIVAINTVPLNGNPVAGFYTNPPGDDTGRGDAITIGDNSFCVVIDDGIGVGGHPSLSGVRINFYDSHNSLINSSPIIYQKISNPPKVCLDGSGADSSGGAGVPDYSISTTQISDDIPNYTIKAVLTDILSLQPIGVVTWNITQEPANTKPVIEVDLLGEASITTIPQDASRTFIFSVKDKDSLDSIEAGVDLDYSVKFWFQQPSVAAIELDGNNTYYTGGNQITPDCVRAITDAGNPAAEDKFSCTISIPSSVGNAPASASGTYKVIAEVQDSLTNDQYGSPPIGATATSDPLEWNITLTEANNFAPEVINWIASGTATPTDSYVFEGPALTTPITSASEGATITFNLNIDDFEKDDFNMNISYLPLGVDATTTSFCERSDLKVEDSNHLCSFNIPYDVIVGVASATVTFTVNLVDVPDLAIPLSNTFPIDLNIINVNPAPEFGSSTVMTPAFNATATVVRGFPYSFNIDEIRDDSVTDGDGIEWQWEVMSGVDCASATNPLWQILDGAIQSSPTLLAPVSASLTWFAPAHSVGDKYCIRNCVGDDGFGNDANCSDPTLIAGPWQGTSDGIAQAYQADRAVSGGSIELANLPSLGAWTDYASPTSSSVYTAHASDNVIYVVRNAYSLDGSSMDTSEFVSFTTDDIEITGTEYPYELSITGNNNYIFVSYLFQKSGSGTPVMRIVRLKKLPLSDIRYQKPTVDQAVVEIGNIVADNFSAYLPYLEIMGGDAWYYAVDGVTATPTGPLAGTDMGLGIAATEIKSTWDSRSNALVLAARLTNGTINLYSFNMPGATLGALTLPPASNIDTDNIFNSKIINFYSLAAGKYVDNEKIYVAAQNDNLEIMFSRFSSGTLDFDVSQTYSVGEIDKIDSLRQMEITAGTESDVFYIGAVMEDELFPGSYNAVSIRVNDVTVDPVKDISPRLNLNNVGNVRPAVTDIVKDFSIGSAGAITDENKKDTFWMFFVDADLVDPPPGATATARLIIVNSEPEVFSGAAPATATDQWTRPWFIK